MTRYRVFLLLLVVTLVGGFLYGRSLWWSISGALFALIVLSLFWAWTGVNWLRVARRSNARVAEVGQTIEEEFRLTNLGRVPKLWVEVRDQSTLPGHYASRVVGWIGGKKWRGWRVKTTCRERGRYELGPIAVRSGDPLGIYQMERKIDLRHVLLVYPLVYEFREFPMPVGYLPGGQALRRRTHMTTTNAAGVRDYVNGDSINRIHWGLSAKRNRLVVKEFELDPMTELFIAVDLFGPVHFDLREALLDDGVDEVTVLAGATAEGAASANEAEAAANNAEAPPSTGTTGTAGSAREVFALPPSTEEYAISMAASVAKHFLRQDRMVGFGAYAQHREIITAERGERQLNKLMETLAVLRANGDLPFERMLRAELPQLARGTTVIAISPSPDIHWAEAVQQATRSGLRVVAIVIEAKTFGSPIDNTDVIAALAETGAVVRTIKCGESLSEAINQNVIR